MCDTRARPESRPGWGRGCSQLNPSISWRARRGAGRGAGARGAGERGPRSCWRMALPSLSPPPPRGPLPPCEVMLGTSCGTRCVSRPVQPSREHAHHEQRPPATGHLGRPGRARGWCRGRHTTAGPEGPSPALPSPRGTHAHAHTRGGKGGWVCGPREEAGKEPRSLHARRRRRPRGPRQEVSARAPQLAWPPLAARPQEALTHNGIWAERPLQGLSSQDIPKKPPEGWEGAAGLGRGNKGAALVFRAEWQGGGSVFNLIRSHLFTFVPAGEPARPLRCNQGN